MSKFRVPATLKAMVGHLQGIGVLLVAKEWERAACVYAYTQPGAGQGARRPRADTAQGAGLSLREFAELGIDGMGVTQVRAYRKAWQAAVDDGHAVPLAPGDEVDLPDVPWKDYFGEATADVQARVFKSVINDADKFREAVQDNPALATVLAKRVVDNPATRVAVEANLAEPVKPRDGQPRRDEPGYSAPPPPPPPDYGGDFHRALNLLTPVLYAAQDGRWQPSSNDRMLFHYLGLLLGQLQQQDNPPTQDLWDEIEKHLSMARGGAQ